MRSREDRADVLLDDIREGAIWSVPPVSPDLSDAVTLDDALAKLTDAVDLARDYAQQLEDLRRDLVNGIGALEEP